jgi:hypothetical protein
MRSTQEAQTLLRNQVASSTRWRPHVYLRSRKIMTEKITSDDSASKLRRRIAYIATSFVAVAVLAAGAAVAFKRYRP